MPIRTLSIRLWLTLLIGARALVALTLGYLGEGTG